MAHGARAAALSTHTDEIHADAVGAGALDDGPRRIVAFGDVAEEPPEHLALAAIDAVERVPRAAGALHLDDDDRRAIGREHEEIGLVAGVARTAPVAGDRAVAERAQEAFRRALAGIARRAPQPEPSQRTVDGADEIERRDERAIARDVRPQCREMRAPAGGAPSACPCMDDRRCDRTRASPRAVARLLSPPIAPGRWRGLARPDIGAGSVVRAGNRVDTRTRARIDAVVHLNI